MTTRHTGLATRGRECATWDPRTLARSRPRRNQSRVSERTPRTGQFAETDVYAFNFLSSH